MPFNFGMVTAWCLPLRETFYEMDPRFHIATTLQKTNQGVHMYFLSLKFLEKENLSWAGIYASAGKSVIAKV